MASVSLGEENFGEAAGNYRIASDFSASAEEERRFLELRDACLECHEYENLSQSAADPVFNFKSRKAAELYIRYAIYLDADFVSASQADLRVEKEAMNLFGREYLGDDLHGKFAASSPMVLYAKSTGRTFRYYSNNPDVRDSADRAFYVKGTNLRVMHPGATMGEHTHELHHYAFRLGGALSARASQEGTLPEENIPKWFYEGMTEFLASDMRAQQPSGYLYETAAVVALFGKPEGKISLHYSWLNHDFGQIGRVLSEASGGRVTLKDVFSCASLLEFAPLVHTVAGANMIRQKGRSSA